MRSCCDLPYWGQWKYIAAVVSYLRFLLNAKVVDPSAMSCFAGKALAHHAASSWCVHPEVAGCQLGRLGGEKPWDIGMAFITKLWIIKTRLTLRTVYMTHWILLLGFLFDVNRWKESAILRWFVIWKRPVILIGSSFCQSLPLELRLLQVIRW